MLATGVFAHLMLCFILQTMGYLGLSSVALIAITAVGVIGFLLLALAVIAEWNLSLEDPDMSLMQMLLTATLVMFPAAFATQMAPLVACAGLALVVVGTNRLRRHELGLFVCYAFGAFTVPLMAQASPTVGTQVDQWPALVVVAMLVLIGPLLYRFETSMAEGVRAEGLRSPLSGRSLIAHAVSRDELTGLFNKRSLLELLAQHKALAAQRPYTFSICHVEIVGRGTTFGAAAQQVDDEDFRQAACIAAQLLREVDCVVRVGHQDFIFVLPGTSRDSGSLVVDRFNQALAAFQVAEQRQRPPMTTVAGVAEYEPGETVSQFLGRAAGALAEDKFIATIGVVLARPSGSVDMDS